MLAPSWLPVERQAGMQHTAVAGERQQAAQQVDMRQSSFKHRGQQHSNMTVVDVSLQAGRPAQRGTPLASPTLGSQ